MTRSRFKAPQDYLRGAGQALGLDLLSFFADDEEGNQQFEGFAPGFKTSAVTKGRGGVLAYKTPKTPTTTTEFSLTPQAQAAFTAPPTTPTTTATTPTTTATTPTTTAAKKSYDFFSAGNLGGPGFGARDLEAAKAAGFSDEDVKTYLNKNQQFFGTGRLSVAQGIIDNLKLNQSLNNPDVERDVNAGLYGSGASGYGLVRMADPAKFAKDANAGKFANTQQTQEFKTATAQPKTRGISTEYGIDAKFFGGADLEAARLQGFSDREIKDYLDASPGLLREQNVKGGGGLYDELTNSLISKAKAATPAPTPEAKTEAKYDNPQQTQDFVKAENVSPGKTGLSSKYGIDATYFGGADVEAARLQGYNDKEIRDYLIQNPSLLRQTAQGGNAVFDMLRV